MDNLIHNIEKLKDGKLKKIVDLRISEFKELGQKGKNDLFKELCFCLMTANFNAKRAIEIQKKIGNGFINFSLKELKDNLKKLGHRFPNARAGYIYEAREYKDSLILERDWLVKNIKGLGLKESSHFLRNIGFQDFAIIDFHIIDILIENKIIEKPKNLNKKNYLEIENKLKKMADKLGLTLAELDLYLWYMETNTILK